MATAAPGSLLWARTHPRTGVGDQRRTTAPVTGFLQLRNGDTGSMMPAPSPPRKLIAHWDSFCVGGWCWVWVAVVGPGGWVEAYLLRGDPASWAPWQRPTRGAGGLRPARRARGRLPTAGRGADRDRGPQGRVRVQVGSLAGILGRLVAVVASAPAAGGDGVCCSLDEDVVGRASRPGQRSTRPPRLVSSR
jgi:hypothetical protein